MEWFQIIKYLRNECSPEEKTKVENWIDSSEENRKLFIQVEEIWKSAENAPDTIQPNYQQAWNNILTKTGIKKKATKIFSIKPATTFIKVAATLLLIVALGGLLKLAYFSKPSMITVSTMDGIKKEVQLTDGTLIALNKNSKLTYPERFKGKSRKVEIEGEAFFKVAKDSLHPFIVYACGTYTRVLGTSFNIKVINVKRILISVVSGKVAFQPENNSAKQVYLTMGDKAVYDKQSTKIFKSKETDINFLSWQTGKLEFENAPLDSVAKVISEYYNKKIEVAPDSKELKITVIFNKQKFDDVIKILTITLKLNVEYRSDIIVLKRKID